MTSKHNLPFEVGQLAEARSNEHGYRGAWFRCKIMGITSQKHKGLVINVEYYDYPDEKPRTMKLYQKCQSASSKSKISKPRMQMMMRPCFPPIYVESQLPDMYSISEVVVVVGDSYRVGDQVDWYTDGCFWTGRITEVYDDGKVKIKLPPPPAGEGSSYEASTTDLRPSLTWSLEYGWSLPSTSGGENFHHRVRLITPKNQEIATVNGTVESDLKDATPDSGTMAERDSVTQITNVKGTVESDLKDATPDSGTMVERDAVTQITNVNGTVECDLKDATSDSGTMAERDAVTSGSLKKSISNKQLLNSTTSDTFEAAVLDLEELVNKVYWLKRILDTGMTVSRPSWKYMTD